MARKRKKLEISCTDTDCESGLHCFRASDEIVAKNQTGACRECGAVLINWPRVHERNSGDYRHTFEMLKKEKIRHFFWHIHLSQKALNHARRKGRHGIRDRVSTHLLAAIGPAEPWHDGFQTPMPEQAENIFPYAQHATATCCRKCLEYWHGIPQGRPLTEEELTYFTELLCLYIEERIPDLTDNGERVPSLRSER